MAGNTGRMTLLEEMGRVDAERMNPNRRAERRRVLGELNRGMKKGGSVRKKTGRLAKRGYGIARK